MSKEEKKKTNRVLEVLENGELINRTIEAFSTSMEKPMTEEQKEAMKKYATDMSEKWSEAILKFVKAIQDPAVQESLEKKLKNIKRTTSED
jgi:hypothetical protein